MKILKNKFLRGSYGAQTANMQIEQKRTFCLLNYSMHTFGKQSTIAQYRGRILKGIFQDK